MAAANLTLCAVLELVIMAFQVLGVTGLCLTRLMSEARWVGRGRVALILALVGLGITGAWCGRLDSEFALFAGGTMTALLIGMIVGGAGEANRPGVRRIAA